MFYGEMRQNHRGRLNQNTLFFNEKKFIFHKMFQEQKIFQKMPNFSIFI